MVFFDEDINTGFIIPQNFSQKDDNGIRIEDILAIARENKKNTEHHYYFGLLSIWQCWEVFYIKRWF